MQRQAPTRWPAPGGAPVPRGRLVCAPAAAAAGGPPPPGGAVGTAVEPPGRLEHRDPHLVDAQRALHRVLVDRLDQVLAADDEARLRAAEQLVARGGEIGRGKV